MRRSTILAAAFSARQIAESAALAGIDTLAVDFFADADTRAAARRSELLRGAYPDGFADDDLIATLERVSEGEAPIGFVYGAGFEDRPDLLERIARRWPILGTGPQALRALKHPETFAGLCRAAGIAHPPIRRDAPADPAGWLSKADGGCGGGHIRAAEGIAEDSGRYFQARIPGESWSAAFVAANGRTTILGFSRQWAEPTEHEPCRYGGAVGPIDPPDDAGHAMREAVGRLVNLCRANDHPILGMASADFRVTPDGRAILLEINPRAGATIDVFDAGAHGGDSMIGRHLRAACERDVGAAPSRPAVVRAAGLAWADRGGFIPAGWRWPAHVRDRSDRPCRIRAGQPIATVIADADDARGAEALWRNRVDALQTMIERTEAA